MSIFRYDLVQQIGSGSYAKVYLAVDKKSRRKVAIKAISKNMLNSESRLEQLGREIHVLQNAHHPYILKLFEVFEDQYNVYLVQEYINHGTLLDYFNSRKTVPEDKIKKFTYQIISAVQYLHDVLHVTHRDLKLENILVDAHENIRIIDFGLCSVHRHRTKMHKIYGTPDYLAPEVISGQKYTDSVDVWAIGVMLYAMTHSCLPFNGESIEELFHNITHSDVVYDSDVSPDLIDLLASLLRKNPAERITLEGAMNHQWFINKFNSESLIENCISSEILNLTPIHQEIMAF